MQTCYNLVHVAPLLASQHKYNLCHSGVLYYIHIVIVWMGKLLSYARSITGLNGGVSARTQGDRL